MRRDWTLLNKTLDGLAPGQAVDLICPDDVRLSSFINYVRVQASRRNVDNPHRVSVTADVAGGKVRVTCASKGNTDISLSLAAKVELTNFANGVGTSEGREIVKQEFQRLLDAMKAALEANDVRSVAIPSVKDEENDLAARKARAAEYLARITPLMHGPADEDQPAPAPVSQPLEDDQDIEF